jgi:hypothetical protein
VSCVFISGLGPNLRTNRPFKFLRSSHNTYLLSRQLIGRSSAAPYTHVLSDRNCRCVEIDVWPSKNGPIVTHGYTLSQSVRCFVSPLVTMGLKLAVGPVRGCMYCHRRSSPASLLADLGQPRVPCRRRRSTSVGRHHETTLGR